MMEIIKTNSLVFSMGLSLLVSAQALASNQLAGTYNLHLFFGDTKPFLDELTIKVDEKGYITGRMHVPGDFDADLDFATLSDSGRTLLFHVPVPEKYKEAYPHGLNYQLYFRHYPRFYAEVIDYAHSSGFVSAPIGNSIPPKYVGSIVGFRKE